jgi:hypothetical protein
MPNPLVIRGVEENNYDSDENKEEMAFSTARN